MNDSTMGGTNVNHEDGNEASSADNRGTSREYSDQIEELKRILEEKGDANELLTSEVADLEAQLASEREKCRGLNENRLIGFLGLDASLRIRRINDAGLRILGLKPDRYLNIPLILSVPPEKRREFLSFFDSIERKETALSIMNLMRPDRKPSYAIFSGATIKSNYERYQLLVIDVTESLEYSDKVELLRLRSKYAEELKRSNEELQQFAYVISHDLREPLRMISSYLGLLENKYQGKVLDEAAKEYMDFAIDGSIRLQQLIDDILEYSRVNTRGKSLQPTDLNVVLSRAIDNLKLMIKESEATITYDHLPTVDVDGLQIMQLFQNLIENAIKFNKRAPRIHISATRTYYEWIISVTDNGIGIDSGDLERIFEIFQRLHTREEYPGTGMGLSISKHIIERHGGKIWAKSKDGEGSTFSFSLPIHREEGRALKRDECSTDLEDPSSTRIGIGD